MQTLQTHRHDPLLLDSRMEQRRIMNRSMKGGSPQIIRYLFNQSICLQPSDQRPTSPESDHHLTYQGEYR